MENNYYIYFHINLVSNEVFYVGKGKGKRAWEKFGRSDYWKRVVNKYGYRVDIIHENLSEKRAFDWEKLYISMFGRKNLVNHTDGGDGTSGYNHTDNTKQKMSVAKKGKISPHKGKKMSEETKINISNSAKGRISPNKGKKMSEETKKKISESLIGFKHSEQSKEKMSEVAKSRLWSEETRKKMSESGKGRIFSEEHKKKISDARKGKPSNNKKNELQLITE